MSSTRPAPSVEDALAAWTAQNPALCHVTAAEHDFIAAMRAAATAGVGYGWMRQMVGIEWRHRDPVGGLDDEELLLIYGVTR